MAAWRGHEPRAREPLDVPRFLTNDAERRRWWAMSGVTARAAGGGRRGVVGRRTWAKKLGETERSRSERPLDLNTTRIADPPLGRVAPRPHASNATLSTAGMQSTPFARSAACCSVRARPLSFLSFMQPHMRRSSLAAIRAARAASTTAAAPATPAAAKAASASRDSPACASLSSAVQPSVEDSARGYGATKGSRSSELVTNQRGTRGSNSLRDAGLTSCRRPRPRSGAPRAAT